jgi:ribonuclease Z
MTALHVLGSGSATSVDRLQTSFAVVRGDGRTCLVDTGGGTAILRATVRAGIQLPQIDVVYVTHMDFDHCGGLPAILYARALEASEPPTVAATSHVVGALRELMALVARGLPDERLARWRALKPWTTTDFEERWRLTPFPARHIEGASGVVVSTDDVSVCFSGDTSPHDDVARAARGASLLVHEATLSDAEAALATSLGHSTPTDAARAAAAAGVERLLLAHVNAPVGTEAEFAAAARVSFKGVLDVARDGLSISFTRDTGAAA